jgi:holo-[acyl-carrier protein] synthase
MMRNENGNIGRLRVGTDLVRVADISHSIEQFGDRYLTRVYTPAELSTCRADGGWTVERLASRFAAKEAATKVLRPVEGLSYQSIEVTLDELGAPELVLHGAARQRAEALGIQDASVSMSHEGEYAVAIVAALFSSDDDPRNGE